MRGRRLLAGGIGLGAVAVGGCLEGVDFPADPRITADDAPEDPPGTPTAAPCRAIEGRKFRSVGRHGDSFTPPDEPGVYHTLEFQDGEFHYLQTVTGFSGTVTCNPADCLADVTGYGPDGDEFTGTYDPVTRVLRWEGTLFRPQGSAD